MAYSRIERHVWDDERFRRWDRDVRDTWLYLLTNKHQNRIGMFVMDPLYVASDVQISVDAARGALEFLAGTGRIMWDPDTRLLFICRHLKHNPIENPNVATATLRELFAQPFVEPLWEGLLEAVEKYCRMTTDRGAPFCEPLAAEIRKKLSDNSLNGSGNRYPNGIGNGMGNPDPDPEPVVKDVSGDESPDGGSAEKCRRKGRDTWLTPYANEWTERAGGEPTFGALARSLKPIEKKHGAEVALRAWKSYLDKTDPQFYSPASFASKIGHWLKESRPAFRGYG